MHNEDIIINETDNQKSKYNINSKTNPINISNDAENNNNMDYLDRKSLKIKNLKWLTNI